MKYPMKEEYGVGMCLQQWLTARATGLTSLGLKVSVPQAVNMGKRKDYIVSICLAIDCH